MVRTARPYLHSDPEWEKMKASCRNLRPADAIRECIDLSALYRDRFHKMSSGQPDFHRIISTLSAKKNRFVLTGSHGIRVWVGRPRLTRGVDILVKEGRNHALVVKALQAIYPELEVRTFTGSTAFFVPGETESVIDVTYPHRIDIEVTLATGVWIEDGELRYRIPTLEAALANKYGAMNSLQRDIAKRTIDGVDFFCMVRHSMEPGREPIDLALLAELGEKVWPGGGGDEILRFVEQAKNGEVPSPVRSIRPAQ